MNQLAAKNCGISQALAIVGGKWTLLILRDLMTGPKHFSELERSLAGISTRTLAQRLDELADNGIVIRDCSGGPAHPVYRLTETGSSLHEIIERLRVWGDRIRT